MQVLVRAAIVSASERKRRSAPRGLSADKPYALVDFMQKMRGDGNRIALVAVQLGEPGFDFDGFIEDPLSRAALKLRPAMTHTYSVRSGPGRVIPRRKGDQAACQVSPAGSWSASVRASAVCVRRTGGVGRGGRHCVGR